MERKQRVKKIMDQRANTSADLAEVLRLQEEHGLKAAGELLEHEQKATTILDKRWEQIDALANASVAKEKPTDNPKWLQGQIRSMDLKLKMRHNQSEADQKSLKATKASLETRLGKVQYAIRKAEQFKKLQADLAQKAGPAKEPGAEAKLDELKSQARVLEEALLNPDPTRSASDLEMDTALLAQQRSEIVTLEQAFDAKAQAESRDHYIARSVLPKALKKTPVRPYTLNGISVRWADMQDALYASRQWPEAIEHEPLEIHKARGETLMLSAEEYEIEKSHDVSRVLQALQERGDSLGLPQQSANVAPALRSGMPTFVPIRNASTNATA